MSDWSDERKAARHKHFTDSAEWRVMARHVKPLLDALEKGHNADRESTCKTCRLLAEWRAKL